MTDVQPWRETMSWNALRAGGGHALAPDEQARRRIARLLDLQSLDSFEAKVTFEPWLEGALVSGSFTFVAQRRCGVTLEPLEERGGEDFTFRFLPQGSPALPSEDSEIVIDMDAEDPPEAVSGSEVDLGHYLVEALALALDPFPRAPGAVFEPTSVGEITSPFAALKSLAKRDDES